MLDQLETLVTQLAKGYGEGHNQQHAKIVCGHALVILNKMRGDEEITALENVVKVREVVSAAAWLHDVLDHKMVANQAEYDQKEAEIKKWLEERFTAEESKLVSDITVNVSFSKEKKGLKQDLGQFEVLRSIVSDADKLEALGEIGLIRCFEHTKHVHPDYSEDQILAEMTVHCHEKLLLLTPSYIKTAPGRELALPRHNIIEAFVRGEVSVKELCVKHGVDYV